MQRRNGERISQQAMETPFLAVPGLIKADVVDGTQGRIFSHVASCFATTLDGNVSNDNAGYRFSFTSQCWRVGTQQLSIGRARSGHLPMLGTTWRRGADNKRITTLPTRHPLVHDTVYLFFNASDNLTTDNITPSY